MNKIKSPYPVIRKGKDIDMNEQIAAWETEYRIALQSTVNSFTLQSTVNSFTLYLEVSEETRNDFNNLREVIRAYQRLGYLDQEEADQLIDEAAAIREEVLSELEDQDE